MNKENFIKSPVDAASEVHEFRKSFIAKSGIKSASLTISAIGVYKAKINGKEVTDTLLNPGYTHYYKRTQYQEYDVTALLGEKNELSVEVGNGWASGYFTYSSNNVKGIFSDHTSLIAELAVCYENGETEVINTDESFDVYSSKTEFAEIYYGETINLCHEQRLIGKAVLDTDAAEKFNLIPQQGEWIKEQERLRPIELIVTPNGEKVIDFGQNMTGYVEFKIKGKRGDRIVITHAEVLDKDGNFYNANYRRATNKMTYTLDGENNVFKPSFSFQGFRYIRLDEYPTENVDLNGITAVVVHSDMKRTGYFTSGNEKINQLYHNTIWGQKSNYLDHPTDCPQRDERLGWTGDAQVFCRTAALNYDVKKFFHKWLGDLRADQGVNGAVYGICPDKFPGAKNPCTRISAAWGDAATVIPWEIYRAYGDKTVLSDNFEMMQKWVEYQHSAGSEEFLWLGGYHYGDWLAMDAGEDSYVGATSNDLIASAFFYHSTDLLVRAGEVLGKDMTEYKALKENIYKAFREYFMENGMPKEELPYTEEVPYRKNKDARVDVVRKGMTQTALVLILHFGLYAENEKKALEDRLVSLIEEWDGLMTTGFVGTPYILHVLTAAGRTDVAYKLLFEERTPSWLYSVTHGATTMWEHWNSLKEDGSFWSTDMNSFNHYAYGSVCDWIYGEVAGITVTDKGAGYSELTLTPHPVKELKYVSCTLNTPKGTVVSNWYYKGDDVYFEFVVPAESTAYLTLPDGRQDTLGGGKYMYTVKG